MMMELRSKCNVLTTVLLCWYITFIYLGDHNNFNINSENAALSS